MTELAGRKVAVLGASSGIGASTALLFARSGALVTCISRGSEELTTIAAAIGGEAVALDTRDADGLVDFFAMRTPFDHVVVSAARTRAGPVASLPLADAHAAMESKFWGAYNVARAARIAPEGSLTFVSGFLSVRPSASSVLQGAINAAIEALARGLALELAPVRVNTVSPGLVDTPAHAAMPEKDRAAMFERAASRLPAGRIGQPEDIARAVLFLAANPYATGSTVRVDGGGAIA